MPLLPHNSPNSPLAISRHGEFSRICKERIETTYVRKEREIDLQLFFQLDHLTIEPPFVIELFGQGFTKVFEPEQADRLLASTP